MGLNLLRINEVALLNMSASARITQALKVNDLGSAQRIAASVAMVSGQLPKPSQAPPVSRTGEHQVDTWA